MDKNKYGHPKKVAISIVVVFVYSMPSFDTL